MMNQTRMIESNKDDGTYKDDWSQQGIIRPKKDDEPSKDYGQIEGNKDDLS